MSFVEGDQARNFFFKSGLPGDILRKIWDLSDLTTDGRLDKREFTIACHLISSQVRKNTDLFVLFMEYIRFKRNVHFLLPFLPPFSPMPSLLQAMVYHNQCQPFPSQLHVSTENVASLQTENKHDRQFLPILEGPTGFWTGKIYICCVMLLFNKLAFFSVFFFFD